MRIGQHDLDSRVFIIAEIGNNHEGDIARAQEMIMRAAEAGADAVKFQTITPEKLVSAKETARLETLSRFRLNMEQFSVLARAAESAGITFLSTPFDLDSVASLEPIVPAYKIASGDNDYFPLLERIAETNKPILLSTGMLNLDGVREATNCIENIWRARRFDPGLALLHCVVAYPTPAAEANLGALREMAGLGFTLGYSDHTIGNDSAVLSIALGARVIEKHFTLDKNISEFRDHKLSADPEEFADLVRRIRGAEQLLGTGVKRIMPVEQPALFSARRSIMAARDLPAGTVLSAADLTSLRPREGLLPRQEAELIGRELTTAILRGHPLILSNLA